VGQKAHPTGLRLGITQTWKSRWFSARNFADLLQEDLLIRRYANKRLEHAGVAAVEILRAPKKVTIDIHTARPGIVIGRKGAEVDNLKAELELLTGKEILLNVIEIKKPELSSTLVGQSIAKQLEGRVSFRRAMKKAIAATMKSGAEGIKICCSGRLGGAEIARTEKYHEGRVPLHTLRADIDYAQITANTTYGTIGVKVWICLGEKIGDQKIETEASREAALGIEEKPVESKRRRARHRRQETIGEATAPSGDKIKPSAKALDKSHRRPKWTGPRRDNRPDDRRPDNRPDNKDKPSGDGKSGGGA
jgi:small subunit ribosomal protein S3